MKKICLSLFTILLFAVAISAQTTKRISFAKGANSATVKTTLVGKGSVEYVIRANAGQWMTIELSPNSKKAELVIVEPDGEIMPDAAGIGGFGGILDYTGDYKIRVLLNTKSQKLKTKTAVSLMFKITDPE